MMCSVVDLLQSTAVSYAALTLGVALGWLCAALCYAARRSEDTQRRALGPD